MPVKLLPTAFLLKLSHARRRLVAALLCYLILAGIAACALDGFLRAAVLGFLLVLAVKSIAHADEEMPD